MFLEKLKFDLFDLDIGGRFESVNLKTTTYERGFFPVAFSSTIKKIHSQIIHVFLGFDFTQRAPNAVELFANGPHHAVRKF